MKLRPHNPEEIGKRFKENAVFLKKPFQDIAYLLGGNEEQWAVFMSVFFNDMMFFNPLATKKEQQEIKRAKALKKKISDKSRELSLLLFQYEDIELTTTSSPPTMHPLDLLLNASTHEYSKNANTHQKENFKSFLEPVINEVLSQEEPFEYCPGVPELVLMIKKTVDLFQFENIQVRQSSVRSTVETFFSSLIYLVENEVLADSILDIRIATLTHLTNVALGLEEKNEISEESVNKAINSAIAKYNKDNSDSN